MKAAIYARYSSQNQSEKSIEDQVRVCRRYAQGNDMTISDEHIYVDEAISGALATRPGLQALEEAAKTKEFDAVVVDDLSRLSRSNHQMLTMVLRFNYYQVKIISVSDGIVTDDENAKIGIHIRGLINEMYLDDLRKKTMRGLEGQKLRGYSAGEDVYGYRSKPVGELKLNKKGQAKYDGMIHYIYEEEAEIVRRIFGEFASGKSIHKIAAGLNQEKVPTKKKRPGGWNTMTISRILQNRKYIGHWDWRLSKNVRDPMTGKCKKVARGEKEHLPFFREDLAIVDQELWDKVQKRRKELRGTWPVSKKKEGFYQQKSYVHTSPTHLLSGLMKCHVCSGAMVLISGKGSGYYGCYNAKRKTCKNTLLVPLKRAEQIILEELKSGVLTSENVQLVYEKVEKLAAESLNQTPDEIKKKRAQLDKFQSVIRNYLEFIRAGNLSKAVSEALREAEQQEDGIRQEIDGLEFQGRNRFKAPLREWVQFRLERFQETLRKNTVASALALREVLGTVRMEPVLTQEEDPFGGMGRPELTFKPYYVAHTKIQTLALLDERHQGSNWSHWRREEETFILDFSNLLKLL